MAREIPVDRWKEFAATFNRDHEGARVTLFAERRSGLHKPIARDVVFRSLAVDTEVGQRAVVVTVDANRDRHLSHTISKPVSIAIDGRSVCVASELGTAFTIEFESKEQTSGEPVATELRQGFEQAWEAIEQAFARARQRVRETRKAPARDAGDDWLG